MDDESRIARNTAELAKVESTVISLEEAFTRLESFETEQERLRIEVEKSSEDESAVLRDMSLTESQAIKRTTEVMARKSVFAARHAAAGARTKEQVDSIIEIGANVRRAISRLIQRLQVNRKERGLRMLAEIFPRHLHRLPTAVNRNDLLHSTLIYSEVINLESRISQVGHHVSEIELADLKNARSWYDEVSVLCLAEPGLDLLWDFGKKQEPVEVDTQPAETHAVAA